MRFSKVAAAAALTAVTEAAVPSNTTICDYYTKALLGNNTASNQLTVLTLLVNTVVIGNYTKPNIPGVTFPSVSVPGILKKGTVGNATVDLLPYFDGGLASSNRGGSSGVAVNFLDDGGATPLMNNMPANGTNSNQYRLLTHLYQFFGTALGCSQQGMGMSGNQTFPSYQGVASQYEVHKYMALDNAQVTYFIEQVGLAAQSFGVASDDISTVANLLNNTFNRRCSPAVALVPNTTPVLEAICIDSDCMQASSPNCSAYAAVVEPGVANSTLADGLGNSSNTATMSAANGGMPTATSSGAMSGSATGSAAGTSSTGAAVKNVAGGLAAGGLAIAAFLL